MLNAVLTVQKAEYIGTSSILEISLKNNSDTPFLLLNEGKLNFHQHSGLITLEPRSITKIQLKTLDILPSVELPFKVVNAVIAPGKYANFMLKATVVE
jgi:hypothetical protein